MDKKMTRITFEILLTKKEEIKKIAESQDLNLSQTLRRAIDLYIESIKVKDKIKNK